jgi:hypothetical protein
MNALAHRPLAALALAVSSLLASCAQIQVNHYLPSGGGELRNRSLCTFGLRDELEADLPNEVKLRVWGGDPDSSALSARVQVLVPPGQNLRFTSNRFTLWSKAAQEPTDLYFTGITTACAADASSNCRSRYAPTDWLEGGLIASDNPLKPNEFRTYRMDLAVPVTPGEPYTLKLPDMELNGQAQHGPTVRFDKTSTPAAANLAVCQS